LRDTVVGGVENPPGGLVARILQFPYEAIPQRGSRKPWDILDGNDFRESGFCKPQKFQKKLPSPINRATLSSVARERLTRSTPREDPNSRVAVETLKRIGIEVGNVALKEGRSDILLKGKPACGINVDAGGNLDAAVFQPKGQAGRTTE
jgi:hypothetical protein